MITTSNEYQTIVCDKCSKSQTAKEDEAGKIFYLEDFYKEAQEKILRNIQLCF
jgi:hypothetical protein